MRPFVEVADELAAVFRDPGGAHDRAGTPAMENIAAARNAGALALTVPAVLGGWGADLFQFAEYQERIARGDGATALILAMHHMLIGGEAEARAWPEAQFAELCRAALERGALVNAAGTEPGAGSPSHGGLPQTIARPADGAWRISGAKAYTTGAPLLAFIRVAARVDADPEPYAARFLVRMPAEGVVVGNDWDPIGLKASAGETVVFTSTPATYLYREDEKGCEGNVWFQVAIAATYLGIGQAAYEAARDYASEHRPLRGGEPISAIEGVRLRLGRMRGDLTVARNNLLSVCDRWRRLGREQKPTLVTEVALAKVVAVNAAAAAADGAMRLGGAAGLGRELPLERFLRETRAGLAHPPVDDVAYLGLAKEELD
jgi:alkylation response protein AidB-like acyl-CoA dehydrogenase